MTLVPTTGFPRQIAIAADGDIWFTVRFTTVTQFPVAPRAGPEGIAASPDGSVWFTQTTKGDTARITDAGVITEAKAVKGSEPFGITVDAGGDPWCTIMSANRIAESSCARRRAGEFAAVAPTEWRFARPLDE